MKFSTIATATAIVGPAVAQSTPPPACLLACVSDARGTCSGMSDFSCICKTHKSAIQACLKNKCSGDDLEISAQRFEEHCDKDLSESALVARQELPPEAQANIPAAAQSARAAGLSRAAAGRSIGMERASAGRAIGSAWAGGNTAEALSRISAIRGPPTGASAPTAVPASGVPASSAVAAAPSSVVAIATADPSAASPVAAGNVTCPTCTAAPAPVSNVTTINVGNGTVCNSLTCHVVVTSCAVGTCTPVTQEATVPTSCVAGTCGPAPYIASCTTGCPAPVAASGGGNSPAATGGSAGCTSGDCERPSGTSGSDCTGEDCKSEGSDSSPAGSAKSGGSTSCSSGECESSTTSGMAEQAGGASMQVASGFGAAMIALGALLL
ncbi:hypothetical protein TRICI_006430 [Trichomonascus ciferrii]|uniref:CFEM domain-containing protein n=1 Tax=Trichomonascus ciferrii TaxID=44093 RepID=A0A642UH59_9ASCO|nr:hypothetical protein TRICI_006430 [Trichomonascus ciferrii]